MAFVKWTTLLAILSGSSGPQTVKEKASFVTQDLKRGAEEVYSQLLTSLKDLRESLSSKEGSELDSQDLDDAFRVMSFNIRWDDVEDKVNSWGQRKESVASTIRFHKADLVGLQEPFRGQMQELGELLPDYEWFGVGWEDGKDLGPVDPIMFRKSRFELLDCSSFYLSDTPNEPSKGWDAKFPRGVTWVKLRDKKSKRIFYFFNTHFDYHGRKARDESAILLQKKIKEIAGNTPFLVTGDFNLFPELEGEVTYKLLTEGKEAKLYDAQSTAQFPHHGPTGTWSGFKEAGQPGIKPDYIFVGPETRVITHGVLSDCFDGKFASDHLPVVSDMILP